jgi:hypothetical protein
MISKQRKEFPIWKPFIFGVSMPIFAKTLHLWLSPALAWAVAGFVWLMLFHSTPPKSHMSFAKVLPLSAAAALFLFAYTKLIG